MLIDTHAHLADAKFDADRDAALQRAQDAGVTTLVEIAESPETWDAAIQLAEAHPCIYVSLGIHPHHAHEVGPAEWPALSQKLRRLLRHPQVVAVGEFGLDYFRMQNTKEQQDFLFRRQLELARELDKPIIIHCRNDVPSPRPSPEKGEGGSEVSLPLLGGGIKGEGCSAHADVQKLLIEFYPQTSFVMEVPRPNGVIHCFSGAWPDAQTYMLHGFVLGFDGPVTYPSSKILQDVVMRMPVPRMVLETDSPYLPPQTHRGQRNEPAHLAAVAQAIAEIKRKTTADISHMTTSNARNLFRLG